MSFIDDLGKITALLRERRILAAVVLATPLTVWVVMKWGASLVSMFTSRGFPSLFPAVVVVAFSFSLALLSVDGLSWLSRLFVTGKASRRDERREKLRVEEAHASRLAVLKSVLPSLNPQEHAILRALASGSGFELHSDPKAIQTLTHLGAIERVARIGTDRSLHKLTAASAGIVTSFLAEQRRAELVASLTAAGEEAQGFLSLFTEPTPSDVNVPPHPFIEAGVYQSIAPLISSKMLQRGPHPGGFVNVGERISLADDAVSLAEEILGKPVRRTHIDLDWSRVGSNVDRGSGVSSRY